eukprot:m.113726 g.113726  ORF g.113726 m.113726 type:complete len:461 (-) comp21483_c0_seq1:94-1476(-)
MRLLSHVRSCLQRGALRLGKLVVEDDDELGQDLVGILHVGERAVLVVAVVHTRLSIPRDLQIKPGVLQVADKWERPADRIWLGCAPNERVRLNDGVVSRGIKRARNAAEGFALPLEHDLTTKHVAVLLGDLVLGARASPSRKRGDVGVDVGNIPFHRLSGGLNRVERGEADVALHGAPRWDLVDRVVRARNLGGLHRGRGGKLVGLLLLAGREVHVESLLDLSHGVLAQLERVDPLVWETRVEELALCPNAPLNRRGSADARLRVGRVHPDDRAVLDPVEVPLLQQHVHANFGDRRVLLRRDEAAKNRDVEHGLLLGQLQEHLSDERNVAKAVRRPPTIELVSLDCECKWVTLPSFGVSRDNVEVATDKGNGSLRGRGLVLDDQVAPLLLEVDVLDVERPTVLDRVRFEQVQKVLDHSVLLRNKLWWLVLDELAFRDQLGQQREEPLFVQFIWHVHCSRS